MEQLITGKAKTMREIANATKMDRSFVARTLFPANLAPDIVKVIREGRQPESLTLDKFRCGIPESREEQRKLFLVQQGNGSRVSSIIATNCRCDRRAAAFQETQLEIQ